jgi:hypothetical protein
MRQVVYIEINFEVSSLHSILKQGQSDPTAWRAPRGEHCLLWKVVKYEIWKSLCKLIEFAPLGYTTTFPRGALSDLRYTEDMNMFKKTSCQLLQFVPEIG